MFGVLWFLERLMQIAMIDDRIVDIRELDPAYMDRGTFFGDGVYEVLRSYDGRIFALNDHLERFARSLSEIKIADVDIGDVRLRILDAFEQAHIANAKIYFHITRGSEMRSHIGSKGLKPNFFLTVTELADNSEKKTAGIKVATHPDWRWKRCDIKSLNLMPNVLAKIEAEKTGCDEAILVDDNGQITEGAGSAFFMIDAANKTLVTRPLGPEILPSITRKLILQVAVKASLTVTERPMTPAQAKVADELFIAVTTQDIVPVTEFDGVKIGSGKPGKYTKILMAEFAKMASSGL